MKSYRTFGTFGIFCLSLRDLWLYVTGSSPGLSHFQCYQQSVCSTISLPIPVLYDETNALSLCFQQYMRQAIIGGEDDLVNCPPIRELFLKAFFLESRVSTYQSKLSSSISAVLCVCSGGEDLRESRQKFSVCTRFFMF